MDQQQPTPTQLIAAARTLEQMCDSGLVEELNLKLDLLGTAILLQEMARHLAASNAIAGRYAKTREEALAHFDSPVEPT